MRWCPNNNGHNPPPLPQEVSHCKPPLPCCMLLTNMHTPHQMSMEPQEINLTKENEFHSKYKSKSQSKHTAKPNFIQTISDSRVECFGRQQTQLCDVILKRKRVKKNETQFFSITFTPEEHPVSGSLRVFRDLEKSPKYESAQLATPHSEAVMVSLAPVYCDKVSSNEYGAQQ